jgi:Protein of unknown function (DUF2510)
MAATHKLSGACVSIYSSLSPDTVAEISRRVGENTQGDVWNGVNNVGFEGTKLGRVDFAIRSFNRSHGTALMMFHVSIAQRDGGSVATTAIDFFRTVRRYFIIFPLPKKLVAYATYRRYMEKLGDAVRAQDPSARVVITEGDMRIHPVGQTEPDERKKPLNGSAPQSAVDVARLASSAPEKGQEEVIPPTISRQASGWFLDPLTSGAPRGRRWWDGEKWTQRTDPPPVDGETVQESELALLAPPGGKSGRVAEDVPPDGTEELVRRGTSSPGHPHPATPGQWRGNALLIRLGMAVTLLIIILPLGLRLMLSSGSHTDSPPGVADVSPIAQPAGPTSYDPGSPSPVTSAPSPAPPATTPAETDYRQLTSAPNPEAGASQLPLGVVAVDSPRPDVQAICARLDVETGNGAPQAKVIGPSDGPDASGVEPAWRWACVSSSGQVAGYVGWIQYNWYCQYIEDELPADRALISVASDANGWRCVKPL